MSMTTVWEMVKEGLIQKGIDLSNESLTLKDLPAMPLPGYPELLLCKMPGQYDAKHCPLPLPLFRQWCKAQLLVQILQIKATANTRDWTTSSAAILNPETRSLLNEHLPADFQRSRAWTLSLSLACTLAQLPHHSYK